MKYLECRDKIYLTRSTLFTLWRIKCDEIKEHAESGINPTSQNLNFLIFRQIQSICPVVTVPGLRKPNTLFSKWREMHFIDSTHKLTNKDRLIC